MSSPLDYRAAIGGGFADVEGSVTLAQAARVPDQGQVAKAAKPRKLKVFRTPIGFHDAYVAAPSQKAALAAWGSDANLFARGVAAEVTDPDLAAEPLAQPGVVVKRLRGTVAEQFAALPPDKPKRERRAQSGPAAASVPRPKPHPEPPPPPKPSRAALDDAERALGAAERRHAGENKALAAHEAELARQRRAAVERQRAEAEALHAAIEQARADYDRAIARWRR